MRNGCARYKSDPCDGARKLRSGEGNDSSEGVPGQISGLYPHIQPAVYQAGPYLEVATEANAKIQAALLRQASTVITGLVKEGQLNVVAGHCDIVSGSATVLE